MKTVGVLRRKLLCVLLLTLALVLPLGSQDRAPNVDRSTEHHVTKEEARQLFRSVDEIFQFASDQTGLPIVHPVKKKLATREQVARYVAKRLKEQGNRERFERTAQPLKMLGLLPRDFDLRRYMLDLYREQVEGWYDTHDKTVYLLDWVAPDEQKPVMAHELVHALQDQNFGLDKWLNVAKDSKDPTVQIALEEQRTARDSAVEGQAMAVLNAYEQGSADKGVDGVEAAPDASGSGQQTAGNATPVYQHAPLYLREALLFPYKDGLQFVQFLLAQRGKDAAFAGVFRNPPRDTRQIMQPATYLTSEPQPKVHVASVERLLGPDWRREDVSGIGQIDLQILLQVWGGDAAATLLTKTWQGGYYVSLWKKNSPNDAISLALVLQFNSPQAAQAFGGIYAAALPTRYRSAHPVSPEALPMRPAADSSEPAAILRQWMTEDGLVSLYVDGRSVIDLESFAPAEAAKLHDAMISELATSTAATRSQ